MKKSFIIGVDADGTCFTHEYPDIGKDIGAIPVLKRLVAEGHRLMLWTMRGTIPAYDVKNTLQEAVDWFEKNDIPLWGVNENPEQKASGWTNSHKQLCDYLIDDNAMGCPLVYPTIMGERPYVDWIEMEKLLEQKGLLTEK